MRFIQTVLYLIVTVHSLTNSLQMAITPANNILRDNEGEAYMTNREKEESSLETQLAQN